MDTLHTVAAPGGAWWAHLKPGIGRIDPRLLAPDLTQPRMHIRESDELERLRVSIRERGVADAIVVTPRARAPWATLAPEHQDLPLVIVSGARRRYVSVEPETLAKHADVPIEIRLYADEKGYRDDAAVLNAAREDLTPLEQGREAVRQQALGVPVKRICALIGLKHEGQMYGRIHLTQLAPDLQRKLSPELSPKRRLGTVIGEMLGNIPAPTTRELEKAVRELREQVSAETGTPEGDLSYLSEDERRFALQRLLHGVIIHNRMDTVRAEKFINTRKVELSASSGHHAAMSERQQPQRRINILETFIKNTADAEVLDWSAAELQRVFVNKTREETEAYMNELAGLATVFSKVAQILEHIRDTKRPSNPEVEALLQRKRA